jgi:hypothetical protein
MDLYTRDNKLHDRRGGRIHLASPSLYLAAMLFLIAIPYLFPQQHFAYRQVLSNGEHLLVVLIYAMLLLFAYLLANAHSLKILKWKSLSPVTIPPAFLKISKLIIWVSLLMNILIVLVAYQAFDGNIHSSKHSLEKFGGINILSQFYLFFVPAYVYGYYKQYQKIPRLIIFFGLVLFVRSFLLAERLAFLEFLIPLIVTLALIKNSYVSLPKLGKYFLYLLTFFMGLELTRQFYIQYVLRGEGELDPWFALSWAAERFFAYYADTQNKFYYLVAQEQSFTSLHILEPFYRVINRIAGTNIEKAVYEYGDFRWVDFTNYGGSAMLYTDAGWFAPVLFMLFVVVFLVLWKRLHHNSFISLCLYPNFVIAIVEFPRFIMPYQTRFALPLIFFLIVVFIYIKALAEKDALQSPKVA